MPNASMARTSLLALAILLSGCSKATENRLETGAKASLYGGEQPTITMVLDGGEVENIPAGTHVEIVSDEEENPKVPDWRKVQVNIREGKFIGRAGTVGRHHLRPARD